MRKPLLLLLLLFICFSCKKTEEPEVAQWEEVLYQDNGSFGSVEIIGNDVYVLWTIPLPQQFSSKTRIYKSENKGEDFSLLPFDPEKLFSGIAFRDEHIGFLAGYRYLARTMDAGNSWDTTGLGLINFESFITLKSHIIAYGTGIYISTDTGISWQQVQPAAYWYATMKFLDEETGFCADAGGKFHKSSDGGMTWHEVSDLGNAEFYQIDFIDKNTGIAIVGIQESPHAYPGIRLLHTMDGGINWAEIELDSHGIELEPESCCVFYAKEQIYLGDVYGIHYSADMGISWTAQYTSYPTPLWVRDLNFGDGFGIATTAWKRVLKY